MTCYTNAMLTNSNPGKMLVKLSQKKKKRLI